MRSFLPNYYAIRLRLQSVNNSTAVSVQPIGSAVVQKILDFTGLLSVLCYIAFLLIFRPGQKEECDPSNTIFLELKTKRAQYWNRNNLKCSVLFQRSYDS
jgi:hypothetical protein